MCGAMGGGSWWLLWSQLDTESGLFCMKVWGVVSDAGAQFSFIDLGGVLPDSESRSIRTPADDGATGPSSRLSQRILSSLLEERTITTSRTPVRFGWSNQGRRIRRRRSRDWRHTTNTRIVYGIINCHVERNLVGDLHIQKRKHENSMNN